MGHKLSRFRFCPACGSDGFIENDERSKRCRDCGFTYYINASGAYVAFILNAKGELLMVRRAKEPAKGTLDLPGGFADPGERAEEGVAREVMEETGLTVTQTKYLFSEPNRYEYSGMIIPTLDLFFLCKVADETAVFAQDDAEEARWVPLSDINPDEVGLHSVRQGLIRFLHSFDER